jgi:hypothetical protein
MCELRHNFGIGELGEGLFAAIEMDCAGWAGAGLVGGHVSCGWCGLAYGGVVSGAGAGRGRRVVRRGLGIVAGYFQVARLGMGLAGRVARAPSAPGELASCRLPIGRAGLRLRGGYWPRGSGARARNFAGMQRMHRGRNPTEVQIDCRTWGPEMPVCRTVLPGDIT